MSSIDSSSNANGFFPHVTCRFDDNWDGVITVDEDPSLSLDINFHQIVLGFALGVVCNMMLESHVDRLVKILVGKTPLVDPFNSMSLFSKILSIPNVILLAPVLEEVLFRGCMHERLKAAFTGVYEFIGLSHEVAVNAARVTAIFFSSIVFGLVHFTNAWVFNCAYIQFLPHAVANIIAGLILGAAKELSGGLSLPIGGHMGTNTLALTRMIYLGV